jgi:UDP-GlcNAc:undecaprenyl-phosphate GlcNAc-1-phosphate transferase
MGGIVLAALVSVGWSTASLWIGPKLGIVDHPDDPTLKAHDRPAVPLGGVGVFAGVHVGLWVEGLFDPGLMAATGLLLVLGLLDDLRRLSPVVRLVGEAGAGALLVSISDLPFFDRGLAFQLVGVALVVVAVNAVNLFDGLDGLVGTTAAITGVGMAGLAVQRGIDPGLGWIAAMAMIGFLVLNWHRAKVFLGDNGAYVVGGLLAYGILATGPDGTEFVVGLGLLGVFGLDVTVAVLRRRLNRRPLFEGDRSHIYDQLRDRGLSVPAVAVVAGGAQAIVVTLVLLIDGVGGWFGVGLVSILGVSLVIGARAAGFLRAEEDQVGDSAGG